MESKKILLIENQYRQFNRIKTYLNNAGYTVFPKDENGDTFDEFINYIRIYLNPRYGGAEEGSRRKEVFERIVKKINTEDFDVLIIDYILVGCHIGETGIFLAEKFRNKGITTPIIFLSREKSNQSKITDNLNENLEPFKWIHKGYDGREILDEKYFNSYVIEGIKERIGQFLNIDIMLNKLIDDGDFNDLIDRINALRKKQWTKSLKDKLESFLDKSPNLAISKKDELEKIINEVESQPNRSNEKK